MKTSIKFFSKIIFTIVLLLNTYSEYSQNKKINTTTQNWSEIDLLGRINQKLKWESDFQYSFQSPYQSDSFLKYGENLTLRSWIHYYIKPTLRFSSYVGLWYNYPIEDNVDQREYPEYRVAAQIQFYKFWGRNILSNRFRTELREIKDRNGNFETASRERYMIKYQRLLNHATYDKGSCYGILIEEAFLNGGSTVTGHTLFDQNRVFVGFGYNFTNDITVETGYFNQFSHHAHDANYDLNNVVQVALIFDNLTPIKHHKV